MNNPYHEIIEINRCFFKYYEEDGMKYIEHVEFPFAGSGTTTIDAFKSLIEHAIALQEELSELEKEGTIGAFSLRFLDEVNRFLK